MVLYVSIADNTSSINVQKETTTFRLSQETSTSSRENSKDTTSFTSSSFLFEPVTFVALLMVAFQNAIAEVPNHAVFDVFETLARVFTKVYEMLTPRILQAFRVGS